MSWLDEYWTLKEKYLKEGMTSKEAREKARDEIDKQRKEENN